MKESKVLSIRLDSEFAKDFNEFCTRNKISKREAFVRTFELVINAEKSEEGTI